MKKRIISLIFMMASVSVFANEDLNIRLIKEYYRQLETHDSEVYLKRIFRKNLPSNIENINIGNIQKKSTRIYSAKLYIKTSGNDDLFYASEIRLSMIKGSLIIDSIMHTKIKNPYSPAELTVIKYYEDMERQRTLSDAYVISNKSIL